MLVQRRRDGRFRLIRQHDHALLAGELAAAWCGPGREPDPLDFSLVLAVALHDVAWLELDTAPALDPDRGEPCPFHALPPPRKVDAYRRGLDRMEALHPYGALLGSLHYTSFPDVREAEDFLRGEAERRRALRRRLELEEADEPAIDRDLEYVRLFDRFSLFVCLAPPSAVAEAQPGWVREARRLTLPRGGALRLDWREDGVLHVDPFPFREARDHHIAFREIGGGPYGDEAALEREWREAPEQWSRVSVRPPPRLA